jgi:tRNA modification GTPase
VTIIFCYKLVLLPASRSIPITMLEETIIAQSTAHGSAIRGMIRINGPEAVASLRGIFEPEFRAESQPCVKTGHLVPWGVTRPIPAKIFYWSVGRGYTGQESVEIHTFGSPPILDAIIAAVCQSGTVRQARPGELTLRAFLSHRLDLTQAEAVLGVIDAPSPKALETALQQLAGGIASPLKRIRETLFETLTHLEAGLDFPEEEIEFISRSEIRHILTEVREQTELLQRRMLSRGWSNEKPKIVLLGQPNAGKSTLFNTLLKTNRAIVSPTPGTTRDYLEADISFDGLPCLLIDTAGINSQSPKDAIDESAQQLSKQIIEQSDLIIYCFEKDFDGFDFDFDKTKTLFVRTKVDATKWSGHGHSISSKTGEGIDLLRTMISQHLRAMLPENVVPNTALRCREAVNGATLLLQQALDMCDSQEILFDESILASQIRSILETLGLIDGSVYTDGILDEIFSRFCIGK